MHNCPAVGFTVPFVPAGSHLVIREHEDYVGDQVGIRYTPEGRAVQSISTERPDGSNDLHVYPGSALGSGQAKLKDD